MVFLWFSYGFPSPILHPKSHQIGIPGSARVESGAQANLPGANRVSRKRGTAWKKSWKNHGKIMENHGKIIGQSWENHGKIKEDQRKNHGKIIEQLWETHRKIKEKS